MGTQLARLVLRLLTYFLKNIIFSWMNSLYGLLLHPESTIGISNALMEDLEVWNHFFFKNYKEEEDKMSYLKNN